MSRKPTTLVSLETREEIDKETGETTKITTAKQSKKESEPGYIKLYLEDIAYFHSLNIKSELLYELLRYVNYSQEIVINKSIKERIAKKINKSLSYVNNNITKLVKNEAIIRVDTGIYQLNTYLFGKGSWKDILKHRANLQLDLFYTYQEGREVKVK